MTESGSRFAARLRRRRRIGSNSAERHRRLRRQHPAPIPVVPTVAAIATPGNLVDWFYRLRDEGGQAAGPDHVTYSMLSRREVWDICRSASELLLAGDSVVSTVRRVNIPKRSGHGLRPISIRSIVARVVEAALNGAMAPFWESVFTGASFGFRPGRGVWDMFLALEDAIDKGYSVIAPDDIFHAFDELPIEAIMAAHRRHIQDEQLLNLIESVLRGINDPQRAKGIDQGSPYSPAALNVLLHAALDTQVCQHVGNPLLHRYADNIVFVCRSVSDGGNAIGHTQEGLSVYGLRLKGEDGPLVDLTRGSTVRILGLVLSLADRQVRYSLDSDAWENLREGLRKAHTMDRPSLVANQVIKGWIVAAAPAIESSMVDLTEQILKAAARVGFREVPRESIGRWIQSAADRWRAFRERHRPQGAAVTGETGGAAPPSAAEPLDGNDQSLVAIGENNSTAVESTDAGPADIVSVDAGCPFST